ncbi:helix-turn-helix transcriptional regulator [Brevibacillus borstelensis]|uniref:helix-turn-helix domain-containing protein n=1 Tax=Brevibacillus TaxID=55080 RepID=UPI00148F7034|nr:helix-turn-helix transcriptional regulator [Brevibacillus borstelensis]MED1854796.1 helix-turn-helix transcriptional regulator [Brevibacillus borstelensis]NOU53802.1 helix-turn-helix transcriptional regulator [Brevibacillus borstelensis]
MSINQRVKQVRQALDLSQAKFAKAISISNGYIAGIELENRKVNERIIKLISSTFNVSEEWLRDGTGDMFNDASSEKLKIAMSIFKKLKPEYQDYVLKQIDALLEMQNKQGE